MLASASGELKTRSRAEGALQAVRHLEDAALALHLGERRGVAGVGHVLAEDDDARVARHLVLQRAVDGGDHRVGLAVGLGRACRRRPRSGRRRASTRRAPAVSGVGFGAARASSVARRDLRDRRRPQIGRARPRWRGPARAAAARMLRERIARGFGLALLRRLVQPLVVGERVRVRTDDRGVHERRLALAAHALHGLFDACGSCRGSRCRRSAAPSGSGTISTSREMSPPGVCTSTGTEIA